MSASTRAQLVQAVRQRRMIRFAYDGLPREVEPHMVVVTTTGHDALSGYQTAGASTTDIVPGWKLFALDKLIDLQVLDRTFHSPRADYRPATTLCARVLAQV